MHTDQLNTPRLVTRPSDNAQMWTWYSDPFGTDAANANPVGAGTFVHNLRFPGQLFDGQVGLHSNGFRDFGPATGRYVEADPIGQRVYFDFSNFTHLQAHRGYWNHLYNYVDNNPVMTTDPRGLVPEWLNWFLEFFDDNTPEVSASKTIGTGLSALCITRNCGKTRDDLASQGFLQHPEPMG